MAAIWAVAGLKEILDDGSDPDVEAEENSRSEPSGENGSAPSNFTFVLCAPDGMAVSPETLQHPPKFMRAGVSRCWLKMRDLTAN
ncbi:MAG: hypothetical protein Q9162_007348 [Coniocarpon cinnabarinum]